VADTKISALTGVTTVAGANELAVNEAGTSKKATVTQVADFLKTLGMPRVTRLGSDHGVTGTTGTEITGLSQTLEAGTYTFKAYLIGQSGTATTGIGYGVNFTGTAAVKAFMRYNVATITTASNGLTEEESGAALVTGGVMNAWASKAYSTTAPNMVAAGVGAINVDVLDIIEGTLIVTASGDLEIWHSSEVASTTTTTKVGSSLIVTRVA
jgi:hypothetical protein